MHESNLFDHLQMRLTYDKLYDDLKEKQYIYISMKQNTSLPSIHFPISPGAGLLALTLSPVSGKSSKQNCFVRSSSTSRTPTSIRGITPRGLSTSYEN